MRSAGSAREAGPRSLAARLVGLVRNLPARLRERQFWTIQAAVLSITLLHLLAEAWGAPLERLLPAGLHHLPVLLYLVPIAYASLVYGLEGALLTGAWAALLSVPNVLVWHRDDLEWVLELVFTGTVVAVGAVMAVPVERARRARLRAEATSRRLALLNEIARLTVAAPLDHTLEVALERTCDVLGADAACVVARPPDGSDALEVLAAHPEGAGTRLAARFGDVDLATLQGLDDVVTVPLAGGTGTVAGLLAVTGAGSPQLTEDAHQLLTGLASQLAVAIVDARLQEREKDRLRRYARQVTAALEDERSRIARELHDETAQHLIVMRRGLTALAGIADEAAADHVAPLVELTTSTLEGVRRFARGLRPPTLDELGLDSALETLVGEAAARSPLQVVLSMEGTPRRLGAEAEVAVYRVAQEALHNVERHADATTATVELTFAPDHVRLVVRDDGSGFSPPDRLEDLTDDGGLGILGMHERAALVGGELALATDDGSGTTITMRVPT